MRLTCVVEDGVSYDSGLWAEHGLCFIIESAGQRLMLDTAESQEVLEHNLRALDLWQGPLDHIVLSHAHSDHTGGLGAVLEHWPAATVHAHSRIVDTRFAGRIHSRSVGLSTPLAEQANSGAWQLTTETIELIPRVWTTGTIAKRPYPLGSSTGHLVERKSARIPDDYADDLSLVLEVAGGVVLLCGCCHAGLRNTLLRLREMTQAPLQAVIGGLHLIHADDAELDAVVETLTGEGCPQLYVCHCTGQRAIRRLWSVFGDAVHACGAGTVIKFEDAL